jgi:hypothetical protein
MMKVSDTLKITGGGYPFMFGRVKYNGNYQIGKVHAGAGINALAIQGTDGMIEYEDSFEVLKCENLDDSVTSTTMSSKNFNDPNLNECGSIR